MYHHNLVQNLVIVTPPASEVITLDQAKQQARVEITDDDALITDLITSARMMCETIVRRTFVPTTYNLMMNAFPWWFPYGFGSNRENQCGLYGLHNLIRLPKPPLITVNSITYVDPTGATQPLDPSLYQVDAGGELPGTISPVYGTSYPQTRNQLDAVTINYTAGYPEGTLPSGARSAVLLLVAHLYRNREATTDKGLTDLPMGIRAVLSPLLYGSYT